MSNMDRFLGPTPHLSSIAQNGMVPFSERSFHRVMALMGLGATAFVAYCIYRRLTMSSLGSLSLDSVRMEGVDSIGSFIDHRQGRPKVILHQIPRGYYTPCIAPFALKLETFLRVANIPYEMSFNAETEDRSTWLTIDGKDISDSSECISHICDIFKVDLETGASKSRLTASRLVNVMLENHLYWGILLWRWVFDDGNSVDLVQPTERSEKKKNSDCADSIYRAAWFHGIGRLDPEQVVELILQDFADLSSALGKHNYFLGSKPGIVDCIAFGMLSQIVWNLPGSPFESEIRKYPNLMKFVYRMKDTFWPDWENVLQRKQSESIMSLAESNSFAWRGFAGLSAMSVHEVDEMATSTTSLPPLERPQTHLSDWGDSDGEELQGKEDMFIETIDENDNIIRSHVNNDVLPTQQRVAAKQNVAKIASRMSHRLMAEYQSKKYNDQLEHVHNEQQRQMEIAAKLQGHGFLENTSFTQPIPTYGMQGNQSQQKAFSGGKHQIPSIFLQDLQGNVSNPMVNRSSNPKLKKYHQGSITNIIDGQLPTNRQIIHQVQGTRRLRSNFNQNSA